jgi:hypothetical protein
MFGITRNFFQAPYKSSPSDSMKCFLFMGRGSLGLTTILLDTWHIPQEVENHVWYYHEFSASTSWGTNSNAIVKCLGELMVLPNFTQCW